MNTGYFKLVIKPKRIIYVSEMDDGESDENKSEVLLHYKPSTESRNQQQILYDSHNKSFQPTTAYIETQLSCVSETWNNEQIDDFVRKLGFLESQTANVKLFQQSSQVTILVHSYVYYY